MVIMILTMSVKQYIYNKDPQEETTISIAGCQMNVSYIKMSDHYYSWEVYSSMSKSTKPNRPNTEPGRSVRRTDPNRSEQVRTGPNSIFSRMGELCDLFDVFLFIPSRIKNDWWQFDTDFDKRRFRIGSTCSKFEKIYASKWLGTVGSCRTYE